MADHVVVAVGLVPNTLLSKSSMLEVDPLLGGYRVNSELQACSDVWVVSGMNLLIDQFCVTETPSHCTYMYFMASRLLFLLPFLHFLSCLGRRCFVFL